MIRWYQERRAMKRALNALDIARLDSEIAANSERLDELERIRTTPCRWCTPRQSKEQP